jgi:hypothetical protein
VPIEMLPTPDRQFLLKTLADYQNLQKYLTQFFAENQFKSEEAYQNYLKKIYSHTMTDFP